MPDHLQNRIVFIAGPTASGKSAFALELAEKIDGEIVNADAMQVYRDLRIVTARPSVADEAALPHHLYGILDGKERCSAGRWAQMASAVISDIHQRGQVAILVGGTGLYFRALETGLSPIPEIGLDIRERGIERHRRLGPEAFREEVMKRDPVMERLPAGDTQRLIRAWEVFEATGKPLSYFQSLARIPLISGVAEKLVIEPERDELYRRCDIRAATMLDEGGVKEVASLLEQNLDPALPIMKALGVPEISQFLQGECTKEQALAELQQSTRRFAKRQLTWFRNQAADWARAENAVVARSFFR